MKIKTTILAWALTTIAAPAQKAQQELIGQDTPAKFAVVLVHVSTANGQKAIKINGAFLKAGVFKKSMEPHDAGQAGDLLCLILGRDMQPLDSILIQNPLRVRTEFPSENDEIGAVFLEYPAQEVLIRFNYSADMKHLRFMQFDAAREQIAVATLPLVFE